MQESFDGDFHSVGNQIQTNFSYFILPYLEKVWIYDTPIMVQQIEKCRKLILVPKI